MDQALLPWITSAHPDTLKAMILETGAGICYYLKYQFQLGKSNPY